MVLPGGFVVGLCGLDFVFEISEGDGIAIGGNFGDEPLFAGVEAYAFILRAGVFSFFRIAIVLGAGGRAQVRPAIVEAVMVDVVNDAAWRDFYYTAVHVNRGSCFSCGGVALGVKCIAVFGNVPFVFAEPLVVFGINDGKHALCQGYAAERIAVAETAVKQQSSYKRLRKPIRYVESNSDFSPLRSESEIIELFILHGRVLAGDEKNNPSIIRYTCTIDTKIRGF